MGGAHPAVPILLLTAHRIGQLQSANPASQLVVNLGQPMCGDISFPSSESKAAALVSLIDHAMVTHTFNPSNHASLPQNPGGSGTRL